MSVANLLNQGVGQLIANEVAENFIAQDKDTT